MSHQLATSKPGQTSATADLPKQAPPQRRLAQPSLRANRSPVLQRKCACGGSSGPGGQCAECTRKKRFGIQPKLIVNQPGDKYEQEADRIADQVIRMPDPQIQRQEKVEKEGEDTLQMKPIANQIKSLVQRQQDPGVRADEEELLKARALPVRAPEPVSAIAAQIGALRGGGHPLPCDTQGFFKSRFGRDFNGVRVHTDTRAAESARAVNALAYTLGRDIVFGAGQCRPETREGRRLLAHELTHVMQQLGGGASTTTLFPPNPNEHEGPRVAETVLTNRQRIAPRFFTGTVLARQSNTDEGSGRKYELPLVYPIKARAEREIDLPDDVVLFTGRVLSVRRSGKTVSNVRAVSGVPGFKEFIKNKGPIPDGKKYTISPQISGPKVTKADKGSICGVPPGSGFQEITSTEPLKCEERAAVCIVDCSSNFGPGAICFTPVGCWGRYRIKIDPTAVEVQKPGGGKVTRDGFYIHGGDHSVTVTSGCIKVFDNSVFAELRKFKKTVPLFVDKR